MVCHILKSNILAVSKLNQSLFMIFICKTLFIKIDLSFIFANRYPTKVCSANIQPYDKLLKFFLNKILLIWLNFILEEVKFVFPFEKICIVPLIRICFLNFIRSNTSYLFLKNKDKDLMGVHKKIIVGRKINLFG